MKANAIVSASILAVVLLAVAVAGGYLLGRSAGGAAEGPTTAPESEEITTIAPVRTVLLTRSTIAETLTAYGTVVAKPSDQQTVSAEIETKVSRLLVSAGQFVTAGEAVAQVEPSPDTALQLVQARNAVDAATRDLATVRDRFNMKLATNQELQASENALRDAGLKASDLKRRGAGEPQALKAPRAGVVAKIDVALGQIVPPGGAIMEIDDESNVEVRLGVQPADAPRLKMDETVELYPVGRDGPPIAGKIRLIARRVNPDTRLVDVFASLPPKSGLLLDSYVRARITLGTATGLVVPRAAVLPEDDGFSLFTVADGHAVKHSVGVGLKTDQQVQVIDEKPALKPGDPVVIVGNYELEDGMPVSTGSGNE